MTTPTQQDREKALDDLIAQILSDARAAERTRVLAELQAWVKDRKHRPVPYEWEVLSDLLAQLDAMAAQEPKEGEDA